jgi:hypothetical protein
MNFKYKYLKYKKKYIELKKIMEQSGGSELTNYLTGNNHFEKIDINHIIKTYIPHLQEDYLEKREKQFFEKDLQKKIDEKIETEHDIAIKFDTSYNALDIIMYDSLYITFKDNELESQEKENFKKYRLKLGEAIYFIYHNFIKEKFKYIDDFFVKYFTDEEINTFKNNPTKFSDKNNYFCEHLKENYKKCYYKKTIDKSTKEKIMDDLKEKFKLKMLELKFFINELKENITSINFFNYNLKLQPNEYFKSKKDIINFLPTNDNFIIKKLIKNNDNIDLYDIKKIISFIKVSRFNHPNLVKVFNILLIIDSQIWYIMENVNCKLCEPLEDLKMKIKLTDEIKYKINDQAKDVIKYLNEQEYLFADIYVDDIFYNLETQNIKFVDWSGFNGFDKFNYSPTNKNMAIFDLMLRYLYLS